MSLSINSTMSGLQKSYNDQLYRSVDRNYDNSYSKKEITNFAADYKESTGIEIDVDGLFKAYDVDVDGALSSTEYKKVKEDDALGMDVLHGLKAEEPAVEEETQDVTSGLSWMDKLSTKEKTSFIQANWRAETQGNLLNAMFGSASLFSGLNSPTSLYSSVKAFSSPQYMSLLTPKVNMLL